MMMMEPLLSARHRRNRLDLANDHKDWAAEGRKEVIFSHETKNNKLSSDGRKSGPQIARRGPHEQAGT